MPGEWEGRETDNFRDEARLFCSPSSNAWERRYIDLYKHVSAYADIHQHSAGIAHGTARIDFLLRHLDVLDTKFGFVLTFNGLLLTAVSLLAAHPLKSFKISLACLSLGSSFLPNFFLTIFGLIWFATTLICVVGLRRVIWGEMTGEKPLAGEEDMQVRHLIRAAARRTNKFRIAMRLMIANVLVLGIAFVVSVFAMWLNSGGN